MDSILSTTASEAGSEAGNLAFQFFGDDLVSNVLYANTSGGCTEEFCSNGERNSIRYGTVSYLTPTLLLAVLSMLYMLFLALCAFCCIMALQTPEKFEGEQEDEMKRALQNENK